MTYDETGDCCSFEAGNFGGECPIHETGRQVTVHFANSSFVFVYWSTAQVILPLGLIISGFL